ncbi:MAG: HAD-IA family hydrolase [Paludibacteraceae bacterium]|nr:HAD-IA family hydrolase [Paludibacteraceae bacterium]
MLLIFDLDGTLLNTIADLGTACNHALQALGYPTHPIEEYPHLVGNGVNKLIERALPAEAKTSSDQTQELIRRMRAEFIPFYNAHNLDLTRPYEGIPETLQALKAAGHKLAVASNKYQEATAKVVAHFFPDTFDVVFGERAGVERKPNPQIVYDIQQALYGNASDVPPTLYIGDSLVDIATARNASLPVAACTWGFVAPEELAAAHPDYLLHQPKELISICKFWGRRRPACG